MRMPLFVGLIAGATGFVALSAVLWLYAGERVYADRLLSAIAGCFG
ncbi:MAG: hypothetical protein RIE06_17205 [Roseibium album]|uniref:Uncharacterized protein n=1 Tax=Roseibium album TaxID=311410 RepID=A0A0M6ZRA6_9HYPH|nr:hypothetical protein [Roseibium album]MBG6145148.1 hypothetical protein [Labrenzia sp. EL_142]MBG6155101.1 hypothetical protein [Labrenzia sp. EL_162]MBG6162361.1 hypothetical protein [Labrenzia sp. EL_195]MBG6173918.1 hypothetical protein [Labrenzia sp. EL_132]MBG6192769.1 hypothetical protein [Labrenzia sp. EL_159]MBG6199156.1 hypothetical protein [Labrenzia sp. EL_13]MBG6206899.1 hypothetical protein [Labrenzia sp. EL_126]MBG6228626.1 hypothetical protein [Labrenzia sp. EL_208]